MTAGPGAACTHCGEPVRDDDRFCEACGQRRPDARDRVELSGPGVAAVSDRGVRHRHNEDAVAVGSPATGAGHGTARLAVVCDGVSRGARPDLASQAAVDAAVEVLVRELAATQVDAEAATRMAVGAAADAVARLAGRADADAPPACTFVSVVLVGDRATVASVGDSRVYWIPLAAPDHRVLTVDDSWRREAVGAGVVTEAAAATDRRRHAITAWLGADAAEPAPRVTGHDLAGPGVLVACTDGLWNGSPAAAELAAAVHAARGAGPVADPLTLARDLVAAALDRGEQDNVTAAVLVLDDRPTRLPEDR